MERAPSGAREEAAMTSQPLSRTFAPRSSLELLRPALWLAAGSFAAGFGGYLALAIRGLPPS